MGRLRKALGFFLLVWGAVTGHYIDEVIQGALQNVDPAIKAELFELDMRKPIVNRTDDGADGTEKRDVDTNMLWPGGVIPYTFSTGASWFFYGNEKRLIRRGMKEWEKYTCVDFVYHKPGEFAPNMVEIIEDPGCWSYVGMQGGVQQLSLQWDGCLYMDTIVHELAHAMGFVHEQSRTDRNLYVDILYDNIIWQNKHNFDRYTASEVDDLGVTYDYLSVLHYSQYAFTWNGAKTIRTKDPAFQNVIGAVPTLSFRDIKAANLAYNCAANCPSMSCPGEAYVGEDCQCWCPGNSLKQPAVRCGNLDTGVYDQTFAHEHHEAEAASPMRKKDPSHANSRRGIKACTDSHARCGELQSEGQCSENRNFMENYCQNTCGTC